LKWGYEARISLLPLFIIRLAANHFAAATRMRWRG
jgi:hypothetical protein